MGQPTKSEIHNDVILTNFASKHIMAMEEFVAGSVFPVVPVSKSSNKYRTWTMNDWFRDEARLRPPATRAVVSGYTMSSDTYSCDQYAIAKAIADQERRDADPDVNLEQDAVAFVTQRLALRREIQWVTDFFALSKWTTDKSVDNQWSDYSNSDPVHDVETGKMTVFGLTGYTPNKMVIGIEAWRYLKNHPLIVERLGLGGAPEQARVVTRQAVAAIFEIDRLFVCAGLKATNQEGATAAYSTIHGKNALLVYAPDSASTQVPSGGAVFALNQGGGAGAGNIPGLSIRRKRDDLADADLIEGDLAWDNKVTAADMGYFFSSVVA